MAQELPVAFQNWADDRLVWDPEEFGNLTDIIVQANQLWLPELAIMNACVSPHRDVIQI